MTAPVLVMPQAAIDADRPGWLDRRRQGITGTEVAQLLGISRYGTPFSLFHAKRDGTETEDKAVLRRGRLLEPEVLSMLADRLPWWEARPAGLYAHGDRPWMLATLDAWLLDTDAAPAIAVDYFRRGAGTPHEVLAAVPAEVKTWHTQRPGDDPAGWWGDPGTWDVPVTIRAQGLWNLAVSGRDRLLIPVLFMDRWKVDLYELTLDMPGAEEDLDLMVTAARAFRDRLLTGDEPDPGGAEADTVALRKLYAGPLEDRSVRVPAGLWRRYHAAADAEKKVRERRRRIGNELRQRMGLARAAHVELGPGDDVTVCTRHVGVAHVQAHDRKDDRLTPGPRGRL